MCADLAAVGVNQIPVVRIEHLLQHRNEHQQCLPNRCGYLADPASQFARNNGRSRLRLSARAVSSGSKGTRRTSVLERVVGAGIGLGGCPSPGATCATSKFNRFAPKLSLDLALGQIAKRTSGVFVR
jgi:hypothetical protein